jgi:hypothetical protein
VVGDLAEAALEGAVQLLGPGQGVEILHEVARGFGHAPGTLASQQSGVLLLEHE